MTTKIIAEHGFWLGTLKAHDSGYGYFDFENQDVVWKMRQLWPGIQRVGYQHSFDAIQEFKAYLEETVPPDTPWVYKSGVPYYPIWKQVRCRKVLVRRNFDSVAESHSAKTPTSWAEITKRLRCYYRMMDEIEGDGVPVISTDEVIKGDYTSLAKALKRVGVDFDPAIADRVIDRTKWHH